MSAGNEGLYIEIQQPSLTKDVLWYAVRQQEASVYNKTFICLFLLFQVLGKTPFHVSKGQECDQELELANTSSGLQQWLLSGLSFESTFRAC